MQQPPTADEVRALIAPLDATDRKVLAGLVLAFMAEPTKIRDEEWRSEAFVHLALVAHGHQDDGSPATTEDVERIRTYAQARRTDIMNAAVALFVRIAEEVRDREGGFTFADVKKIVADYLQT
jgi:hypothetical protein